MSEFFPPQPVVSPGDHPEAGKEESTYTYHGWSSGPQENKYDLGAGVYKSDNVDFLNASADLGFFAPPEGTGTQFGARGEMNSIGFKGTLGTLAEMATLGAANTTPSLQGGIENFVSAEVHGPRAAGEASIGSTGINLNGGVDGVAGSVKIGGAEYDGWSLGGSEFTVGAGVGFGIGGGLTVTDDDKDGYNELGGYGGAKFWEGAGIGFKTEIPAYLYEAVTNSSVAQNAGEMIMEKGDALRETLFPPDEGLKPQDPPTTQPPSAGFR